MCDAARRPHEGEHGSTGCRCRNERSRFLAEAADLSDGSKLVFPGMRPGRPLSENTHAKMLRELGFAAVTHGFRSSFRDYAAERTHTPHAVMEAALAHTIQEQGGGRVCPERPVRQAL